MPRRQDRNRIHRHLSSPLADIVSMPRRQDRNTCFVIKNPLSRQVGFHASQVGSKFLQKVGILRLFLSFHASQVGSKLSTNATKEELQKCFHASQVGSKQSSKKLTPVDKMSFHASQVGSKLYIMVVLYYFSGLVSMPRRQDRNINYQIQSRKSSYQFPCLVGRIEILYITFIYIIPVRVSMPRRQDRNEPNQLY